MIVKNEEEHLEACLKSVQDLVDEMVLIDTGSSDGTIEIAKQFGAKVFHHPWEDDFSKARNLSLQYAQGSWVLVLDADEVISEADHVNIRKLISEEKHILYSLIQTTYLDDSCNIGWKKNELNCQEAQGYPGYYESALVRLFKLSAQTRFEGRIHEHLRHQDHKVEVIPTKIRIHHYGKYKSLDVKKKKSDLYLDLTIKKYEENPKNSHFAYELAAQYFVMSDLEKSEILAKEALSLNEQNIHAYLLLISLFRQKGKKKELIELLLKMMQIAPQNSHVYAHLPLLLAEENQYELCDRLLNIGRKFCLENPIFHINEGVIKQMKGNHHGAITCFKKALEINPQDFLAWFNKAKSEHCLKKYTDSILSLSHAEEIKSEDLNLLFLKSEVFWSLKENHKAREIIDAILNQDPHNNEALYRKVVLCIQEKNFNEAREILVNNEIEKGLGPEQVKNLIQCYQAVGINNMTEKLSKAIRGI